MSNKQHGDENTVIKLKLQEKGISNIIIFRKKL